MKESNERKMKGSVKISISREVLLVEIERRCLYTQCGERTRLGLTKAEARAYRGFSCERCGRWTDDELTQKDIPEWWEEIEGMRTQG